MANCPNCNQKLHFWNLRAECPHCKANIPNHNWEKRLEEDALEREKAFYKMHSNLNKLKFSVLGTNKKNHWYSFITLRLVRFILCFLPIIGYVVPLGSINYTCEDGTVFACDSINAIALFTKDTFKFTDIFSQITAHFSLSNNLILAFVLLLASLLFGVLAFFFILILCLKFKQPVTMIFHVISLACYTLAAVEFNNVGGDVAKLNMLVIIGIVLFAAALVMDIICLVKKIEPTDGKYVPDANKDELQAEYAESIGEPFKAKKEEA